MISFKEIKLFNYIKILQSFLLPVAVLDLSWKRSSPVCCYMLEDELQIYCKLFLTFLMEG
jgi:hypothetical protein